MTDVTYKKALDRIYYPDDRDAVVKALPEKERLPKYGTNSLEEPNKAFSADVAASADRIGMPKQNRS